MKYENIIRAISETPWLIHPPKLEEIVGVIEARLAGASLTPQEAEGLEVPGQREPEVFGGVAVLPLMGTISHRIGLMTGSGGVSTEQFGRNFDAAMNDADVSAIVMDVDSSGGSAAGTDELASKIYKSRGKKPIVAVSNTKAHSAAYYIASAADELVVTPSGMVGSIGTVMAHVDYSEANAKEGIKVTYIHAGKNKVEGNPDEPLTEEARADIQRIVDAYNDPFVAAVSRHRGVSKSHVNENYGQGRVFTAKEAVKLGMADKVETLESVVSRLAKRTRPNGRASDGRRLKLYKTS